MKRKNILASIKSKSIKETKEEINKILEKFEKDNVMRLNKHIDKLFKKRSKLIKSIGKKND